MLDGHDDEWQEAAMKRVRVIGIMMTGDLDSRFCRPVSSQDTGCVEGVTEGQDGGTISQGSS